jgi:hypothetical protein
MEELLAKPQVDETDFIVLDAIRTYRPTELYEGEKNGPLWGKVVEFRIRDDARKFIGVIFEHAPDKERAMVVVVWAGGEPLTFNAWGPHFPGAGPVQWMTTYGVEFTPRPDLEELARGL